MSILGRSILFFSFLLAPRIAFAEGPPTGAPPAEGKAMVEGPKAPGSEPKIENKVDGTTLTFSSGGLYSTGNSRLLALSANGIFESRFDKNGVGVSVVGNYGQGAPPGQAIQITAENVQGRIRYDRYFIERASGFMMVTGRHDRLQGLDFRLNLDPGVRYLFLKEQARALWAEAGYDFQADLRRDDARAVLDADKKPVVDADGRPVLLDRTATDHSTRLFVGYRHAFNKEVTLSSGLEYLQSVVDATRYRVNFDALFAAKVGGGLAVGFGFSARFDHAPLPGKEKLDTTTTMSLIYSFSDVPEPPPPPAPCPATATPPPPPIETPPQETK